MVQSNQVFTAIPGVSLANGCKFDFSYANQFRKQLAPYDLSLKYVIEGEEIYNVNGKDHKVHTGQFLTVNNQSCEVIIDSKDKVKGMCIALPSVLFTSVLCTMHELNLPRAMSYLQGHGFFELVSNANASALGSYLQQLSTILQKGWGQQLYLDELFLHLTELAVAEQVKVFRELSAIHINNTAARKDIYARLLMAREYLAANLNADIKMEDAATAANLSEYHFYRLFKASFKCTPYQYHLERRLVYAKSLLEQGMSVSDTAIETGFSSIQVFSRAFKRRESISPATYMAGYRLNKR